ncbi:MAG: DUF4185 domain-containing protein [Clostridia bacterium]|nr:DUF4185 domain-containing protein [Clostridia bacterium]
MKRTTFRKLTGILLCAIMLFTLNAQALLPALPAAAAEPAKMTVPGRPVLTSDKVFYMSFTGADANDGLTKTTPKKTWGSASGSALASLLGEGGTVVAVGKAYVGANYTLPAYNGNTVLFTAKDTDGTSYLGDAASQLGNILGHTGKTAANVYTFTMTGNVIFQDIGLLNRNGAAAGDTFTFKVAEGAKVVVGTGVVFQNVSGGYAVPKLIVDEGGVAFLDTLGFSRYLGEGTVIVNNALAAQINAEEVFAEFEGVVADEDGNVLLGTAPAEEEPATSGSCGENVNWEFDGDTGTLRITGSGAMADYAADSAPWRSFLTEICAVEIENSVTRIGNHAFSGCSALPFAAVPNGVTSIGVNAFRGCASLATVTIPDSVTSIGSYAFYGCSSLTTVYYTGTEAEWQAVSIGSGNQPLTSAEIRCGFVQRAYLDSASLSLADAVGVNFYTVLSDALVEDAGAYALFSGPNGVKKIFVSEAPLKNGRRIFSYPVFAKQTREDITIRFFSGAGEEIDLFLNDAGHTPIASNAYSYSVGDYLTAIDASGEGTQMKNLAAALADYGAAADRLFGYSQTPPAIGEDLSSITADTLSAYRFKESGVMPEGFALTGATLLLQNETTLRIYFTCEGTPAFTVTVDGAPAEVKSRGGEYYVEIPHIAAKELGVPHTVRFGDYRAVCSALTYAYSVLKAYPETDDSEAAQNLRALARTLSRYGDTAERYFSVARGDEATVVFVTQEGAGEKDGSSPANAAALADGLGKTKRTGGTVVVCGPLTFEKDYTFPSAEAPVTLTSVWEAVDYRTAAGASLTFRANALFEGDYTLDGLKIVSGKNNLIFCFQYHNVTVGADVDCVRESDSITTDIALICGSFAGNSSAYAYVYQTSCREDAAVTVRGGTWQYIRGGNFRPKPASVFGTVEEGVTFEVFVEGGRFTAASGANLNSASGMNGVAGRIYMEISGGTFDGPVYLFSRTGANDNGYAVPVTGSVTLKITGGTFNSTTLAVCQPTSGQKIDLTDAQETVLCVAGGSFPSGTAAVGESGSRLILGSSVTVTKGSGFTNDLTQKSDAACAAVQAPDLTENGIFYTGTPEGVKTATEPLTAAEQNALGANAKSNLQKINALLAGGDLASKQSVSDMTLSDPLYSLDRVNSVRFISLLTGEYSQNRTLTNYDIARIGGGYMIDCGDSVLLAFGDTKTEDGLGAPWRANALAFTTDCDYTDGIALDGFYMGDTYQEEPFAGEFLLSGHDDKNKTEESKIPTGGIKIGNTLYYCYMSVASWRETDREGCWPCNYGGIAKSTDFGRSWETPSDLRWPAGTDVDDPVEEIPEWGFAQLYPVLDGDWVYFFGVPGGRGGYCRLMRVKQSQIENFSAYEYMTGRDGDGNAVFERGYEAMMTNCAAVDKCVGGVGVMYNDYLGEWVMFYCTKNADGITNSIVMRTAKTLDGEWSDAVLVMRQSVFGSVYEPRVCSAYTREGGRYMMVITSRSDIYQSLVWEVEVSKKN